MLKQVTPVEDIVNLCTIENRNTNMWKYQILREEKRARKQELQSIIELPIYAEFVRRHEILWGKKRKDFNQLEKESIERKYKQMMGE